MPSGSSGSSRGVVTHQRHRFLLRLHAHEILGLRVELVGLERREMAGVVGSDTELARYLVRRPPERRPQLRVHQQQPERRGE